MTYDNRNYHLKEPGLSGGVSQPSAVLVKKREEVRAEPKLQESENEAAQVRQWVRLVKEGDNNAFTRLVSMHQKQVFKLAYGFFKDRDDAMEIVQETFMRIYEKIGQFDTEDGKTSFKSWVYRVAYNLCIDYYRKFHKKKADDRDLHDYFDAEAGNSGNPEDNASRTHFDQLLKKHVMKLSRRQRMVFALKHFNQMKHHEIAETLNVSVGTVKSLYHRATKALQKKISRLEVAG